MLFKTRVGLCVLNENIEIHAFPPKGSRSWNIAAQRRAESEMEGRSLFGRKIRFQGPWYFLAAFTDSPTVETEVGNAMQLIADAFAGTATTCDLTQVGSVEAWRDMCGAWKLIRWP